MNHLNPSGASAARPAQNIRAISADERVSLLALRFTEAQLAEYARGGIGTAGVTDTSLTRQEESKIRTWLLHWRSGPGKG